MSRVGMAVALVVLLAVPAGITAWDQLSSDDVTAPDFTFVDTGHRNGTQGEPMEVTLSDFRGKTVVLDFMAYNCGSCRFVTPRVMDPLYEEFGADPHFVILTIDVGEFSNFPGSNTENLISWQEEFDSPWIHGLDTDGLFLDYVDLGAIGLPSVFIVDPDGTLVFSHSGVPDKNEMATIIEASLAGEAESVSVLTVGIIGLAFVAGLASFFAPCSVGLIPAYMGFLLQAEGKQASGHGSLGRSIRGGLSTAAGIVALYAVLAAAIWAAGDVLSGLLPKLGLAVGVLLVLFGALMLGGFDWERIAKWFGLGKVDGRKGFFAFGVGYGLAAFGCTGPILFPILIKAFAEGTAVGMASFLVYTIAVASFVLLAAYLVGAGQQTRLRALLSHTKTITRVAAVLLIGAGVYLIWFEIQAFGW